MRKKIFQILIGAAVFGLSVSLAAAQNRAAQTTEVNIYLLRTGETAQKDYDEKNPYGLVAVKRTVEARSPLRNALIALTGEVTKEEERENLFSPTWGIKLVSVRLEKGTAYAYFTMPEEARFSGDGAPFIFKSAVEQTARQFKTVKKVVVCLDGILDFGSESEEPPRRCGK